MKKKQNLLVCLLFLTFITIWGLVLTVPPHQNVVESRETAWKTPLKNLSYPEYCRQLLKANGTQLWNTSDPAGGVQSVCIIEDVNSDGIPDVVAGSSDNNMYCFDGESGQTIWVNDNATDPILVCKIIEDLDGDNYQDVVCGGEDHKIRLINGQTGGLIWENSNLSTSIFSMCIIDDIDNDGFADIVVGSDTIIYCVSGVSGGHIWNNTDFSSLIQFLSLIPDINFDGRPDIIAGRAISSSNLFCLNGWNGSTLWTFDVGTGVKDLAIIEDINGDGISDVLAGGIGASPKLSCVNGKNGTEIWNITYTQNMYRISTIQDVDNDGYEDVVIGVNTRVECVNGKNGTNLWNQTSIATYVDAIAIIEDINGNGYQDVIMGLSGHIYAIDGRTGDELWDCTEIVQGVTIYAIATLQDINGDGIEEVIVGMEIAISSETVFCLSGRSSDYIQRYQKGTSLWSNADPLEPLTVSKKIEDITGDGIEEVLVGGVDNRTYCLDGRDGTQIWNYTDQLYDDVKDLIVIDDVNEDGFADVAIGSLSYHVYLLDGKNGARLKTLLYSNRPNYLKEIEDIDGDGFNDIIIVFNDGYIECLNARSFNSIWANNSVSDDVLGIEIIEDVNNDGFSDLIVGRISEVIECRSGKDGSEIWNFISPSGRFRGIKKIEDINSNGYSEVIISNDSLYCLDGKNGNFNWKTTPTFTSYDIGIIKDITGDGLDDVIAADHDNQFVYCFYGSTGGQLWQQQIADSGELPYRIAIIEDITNDHFEDVIVSAKRIYALDGFDGSQLWRNNDTGAQFVESLPILEDVSGDGINEIVGISGNVTVCISPIGDDVAPILNTPAPPIIEQDVDVETIDWTITELSIGYYCVLIEGSMENGGCDWTPYAHIEDILYPINQSVPVGLHNYTIICNDSCGNYAFSSVFVLVQDTIFPGFVDDLEANFTGGNVLLNWSPPPDQDIVNYCIYRSEDPYATPGPSNWIANTTNLNYSDSLIQTGKDYYYVVQAFDDAGNPSGYMAWVQVHTGNGGNGGFDYSIFIYILIVVLAIVVTAFIVKRRRKSTAIVAPKRLPGQVEVVREFDYVGAGVRFKVAVRNNTDERISDITCSLNIKDQFITDKRIQTIKVLDPGESRGIDYILYPIICGKSYIDGVVTFQTGLKEPQSITVAPKLIEIKCPLVKPTPVVEKEIDMLQKQLQRSYTEIEFQPLNKEMAFKVALEQISALDLNEIKRDFENFVAYYAGEAKVSENTLIIKASIQENRIICEVWTNEQKQAIGFLAYIKNLIVMSLDTHRKLKGEIANFAQNAINAFEVISRFLELNEIVREDPQVEKTLLTMDEITTRIIRYFPEQERLQNIQKMKLKIEHDYELNAQLSSTENYDLQYQILFWMQELINIAKNNINLFKKTSETYDEKLLTYLGGELPKAIGNYNQNVKSYSLSILRILLVIHSASGVALYRHNFGQMEVDADLISGFLTAIQSFGVELSKEETTMKSIRYQNFNIELQNRKNIKVALVVAGKSTDYINERIQTFIQEFEDRFSVTLENWTGQVDIFEPSGDILKRLYS